MIFWLIFALRKTKTMGKNRINLEGQRFGSLVVLSYEGCSYEGIAEWRCKCDCGREFIALSHNIRYGRTKSCGCRIYKKKI